MNPALLSLRSLFASIGVIHLATSAMATLVALQIAEAGQGADAASFAAASYAGGFLLGCFYIFGPLARIGHIRAFAAAAALCTIGALVLFAADSLPVLLIVRFGMGVSTAALYAIGDAWINDTADNASRGRTLSVYYIVIGITSVLSQIFVILFTGEVADAFVAMAALYAMATVVLAPTRTEPPQRTQKAALRVVAAFRDSPTAMVGVFINGIIVALLLNVVPFRMSEVGFGAARIGILVGAFYLGRILLQFPLGNASDRRDRRIVIAVVCGAATALLWLLSVALALTDGDPAAVDTALGIGLALVLAGLLGGTLMPLYAIYVAHALDRTVPVYVGATAVTLLFMNTLGGVLGPLLAGGVLAVSGGPGVALMSAGLMAGATLFTAVRIFRRGPVPTAETAEGVVVAPTSVSMTPDAKRR